MKREETIFTKPVNLYYMLLGSTLALSLLGLIMVFSASSIYSLGSRGTTYGVVIRQFLFLLISLPMAWVLSRLSLRQWKSIARFGLLISVILLALVQLIGKSVNGNNNWISLGFVDVQPSEVAKFLLILWAGHMLAIRERAGAIHSNVVVLIGPAFLLCMILVMAGRDLGTASVFAFILAGLLWVSGLRLGIFGFGLAGGLTVIAVFILTVPNRAERFAAFLNPFAEDQYKFSGWQPAHSLLGLASGGLFGVGLGASRQKWGNLSQAHTDFIFSVIGEELGLLGTLLVLVLYAALIYSILRVALKTKDDFSRYATAGVACWFIAQVTINIGSVTSLLPVIGVTLPLISYGGSSLLANLIAIGYVLGVARRTPEISEGIKLSRMRKSSQ